MRITLNAKDSRLANSACPNLRAVGRVIIEEGVKAYAITEDIRAAEDTETPAVGAICPVGGREDRIGEGNVCWEGNCGVGVGLIIAECVSLS